MMQRDGSASTSLVIFDINSERWYQANDFKVARQHHSSCFLKTKLFLFGGCSDDMGRLSSIETMDVANNDQVWSIINDSRDFTKRTLPLVCAISETQIAIMGGWDISYYSDILIYDDQTKTTQKVMNTSIGFDCNMGQAIKGSEDGNFHALIYPQSGGF